MDLAIGARDEALDELVSFGFGLGSEAGEIGGGAFEEEMEALDFVEAEAGDGLGLKADEHGLQLLPVRALGGDETWDVDDHRSWRCLMLRYSETRRRPMRSLSKTASRTPRRWRRRPTSSRLCQRRCPPRRS